MIKAEKNQSHIYIMAQASLGDGGGDTMETFTQHLNSSRCLSALFKAYHVVKRIKYSGNKPCTKYLPIETRFTQGTSFSKKRESESFLLPETACIATIRGQNPFRLLCGTTKDVSDFFFVCFVGFENKHFTK